MATIHGFNETGKHRKLVIPYLTLSAAMLLGAGGVQAECMLTNPTTWNLGGNGSWGIAANWAPATVPNHAGTNVCITDGTSAVTLNQNATIGSLQIAAGNGLVIGNNRSLTLGASSATIDNAGTIELAGTTNSPTRLRLGGGEVTLSGGGQVQMANNRATNRIDSSSAGSQLTNVDNTITGAGQILGGNLAFINQQGGVIEASSTTSLTISGFSGTNAFVNDGVLRSTNSGGLVLSSSVIDNTGNSNGGRITAHGENAHVDLSNTTIRGGILSTTDGGVIEATSGTSKLDGTNETVHITGGSTVRVKYNQNLVLDGDIDNVGTIELAGTTNSPTRLRLDGGEVTLSGGGQVQMANRSTNIIDSSAANSQLTNIDNTITGAGQILGGNLAFINQQGGVIEASETTSLTISGFNSTNAFVNDGVLRSTNSGGLVLSSSVIDNTGNSNGGLITAHGEKTHVDLNNATILGGTLSTADGGVIQLSSSGSSSSKLDGTSETVHITDGSTVRVTYAKTLVLDGDIDNVGTIELAGTGLTNTKLNLDGGEVTLSGGGQVQMANRTTNIIDSSAANSQLTNVDNTITGAGQILGGNLTFINQQDGVIDASETTSLTISGFSGTNAFVNDGVLRSTNTSADNDGLMLKNSNIDNTGNNNGGQIIAHGENTHVDLESTTILGGTLSTADGGVIQVKSGGNSASKLDGTSETVHITDGSTMRVTYAQNLVLDGDIDNAGTIELAGMGLTDTRLRLDGGEVTLSGGGQVQMANRSTNKIESSAANSQLTNVDNTITGAGQILGGNLVFINQQDGVIDASETTSLTISGFSGTNAFVNQGTLRASGTGGLVVSNGKVNNQGVVEALADSKVVFESNASATNLANGTLTGGIWRANSTGGSSALIDFQQTNSPITINAADIQLIGAGANIQTRGNNANAIQTLGDTLTANTAAGILRLQQGHTFSSTANSGDFSNAGLIEASNSTFRANTLANDGAIAGYGNSTIDTTGGAISGSGSVIAETGTLTLTQGVNMGAGSLLESKAGAALNMVGASAPSQVATLVNDGSLVLGGQNLVVTQDYTNANFGVGNDFDRRANVDGAGLIIGDGASQTITGNVTSTGTDTWSLDIGTVRGGTVTNAGFQVANDGTGADIRGALQTSGLDSRLTGDGVTAGNFGPIAAGANSGDYAVSFNASSGGAISGQLQVVSNFDNVATQTIHFNGLATALAQGNATPDGTPDPVDLGNFRVGSAGADTSFAVQNVTTGDHAEQLGINSVTASNGFGASNVLGSTLLTGGASQAGAITAHADGNGSAGINTGTLTIQYATDGTSIDSSFTRQDANQQQIALQATGYNAAVGNTSSTVIVANQHVGDSAMAALSVSNTAAAGSYSEDLGAGFGINTGSAINNGGAIGALLAGSTDSTTMQVGVDTSSAGAKTGTVTLGYQTMGAVGGTSNGLGTADVGTDTITVTGNVYRLAEAVIDNPGAFSFGNVHVGDSVQQALSITNNAVNDGYSESLNASFGGVTDSLITTSGSITQLGAGATDSTGMVIGVNTATAGAVNGAVTLNFASDGAGTSELGITNLPSQDVSVSATIQGGVYRLANPVIETTQPLDFGNVRIGTTVADQALSIRNDALNDGYSESLNASAGGTTGGVTASGAFDLLAAQGLNDSSIRIGLDTSVAGDRSGMATIQFESDGAGTSDLGITPLASQNVQVNGAVYRLADPTLNTSTVTIAARVGDTVAADQAVSVTNSSPDAYTEGLKVAVGNVSGNAQGNGSIANLGAQATDSGTLLVGLGSTNTAGLTTGTVTLEMASTGAGTTEAVDLALASQDVTVQGKVYAPAVAQLDTTSVNFGIVRVGDTVAARDVQVSNAAAATALNDTMAAQMGAVDGPFTGSGNVAGLGAADSGTLSVGLNPGAAGLFNGNASIDFASQNPDMADLDLGMLQVSLSGQVNNLAEALFIHSSGAGNLSQVGNDFTLDLGTLYVGDSFATTLGMMNDADGPYADSLWGSFDLANADDFTYTGWDPIEDLALGLTQGGLLIDYSFAADGQFTDTVTFNWYSYNEYSENLYYTSTLTITANVRDRDGGGSVPEPATLAMILLGAALAYGARRRRSARGH